MRPALIAGFAAIVWMALSGDAWAAGPETASAGGTPPPPATSLSPPGAAAEVSCQVKAGWTDPYPSVVILKRLAPECSQAEVQVIRTNGQAYPTQCVAYRKGRLTIATATGDYHLTVGRDSLTGDFVSRLDPRYSRTALHWSCNKSPALVTDPMRTTAAVRRRPSFRHRQLQ